MNDELTPEQQAEAERILAADVAWAELINQEEQD